MTLNVGLGTIPPATQPKSGSRGEKDAKGADLGFNEALADKPGKKTARHDTDESSAHGTRPALEKLVKGLDMSADEHSTPLNEDGLEQEANFDAILEGVLLDSRLPDIEKAAAALSGATESAEGTAAVAKDLPPAEQPADETEIKQNGSAETIAVPSTGSAIVDIDIAARAAPPENAAAAAIRPGVDLSNRQRSFDNMPGQRQQGPVASGSSSAVPANTYIEPAASTQGTLDRLSESAARFSRGGGSENAKSDGQQRVMTTTGTDSLSGRVSVLYFNPGLAPSVIANPLLGQTASGLVSAMESDATWRAAAAEDGAQALQRGQALSSGVNTLRIQLHPIELGMVTARLTASGEQLSVEIQVETNDARQKLAADSESILKALRSVGYDVDKVTITQNSSNASGQGQQTSSGRDSFAPNQQAQGDGDARGRDSGRGAGAQHDNGARHGAGEQAADRAGGSLYI